MLACAFRSRNVVRCPRIDVTYDSIDPCANVFINEISLLRRLAALERY